MSSARRHKSRDCKILFFVNVQYLHSYHFSILFLFFHHAFQISPVPQENLQLLCRLDRRLRKILVRHHSTHHPVVIIPPRIGFLNRLDTNRPIVALTLYRICLLYTSHTVKGKGVSFMEDQAGWHGKAPNDEEYQIAMADLERIGEALCQK